MKLRIQRRPPIEQLHTQKKNRGKLHMRTSRIIWKTLVVAALAAAICLPTFTSHAGSSLHNLGSATPVSQIASAAR